MKLKQSKIEVDLRFDADSGNYDPEIASQLKKQVKLADVCYV